MEERYSELARTLTGRVVTRDNPDIVLANKQFAADLPFRTPSALIQCRSEQDVVRALDFLSAHGESFSIRSGGHCFGDLSSSSDIQLDLGEMNELEIDGEFVRVGPGARSGDLVQALVPHGITMATGGCPLVGIGGVTLVGGFGFLGRKHGLTSDRLAWARVVLADGRVVTADETTEPDLFWALRGAGAGGFGVVTELGLRPVPTSAAVACFAAWPMRAAAAVIDAWQRWAPRADGGVNIELGLIAPETTDQPCYIRLYGVIACEADKRDKHVRELKQRLGSLAAKLRMIELERDKAALYAAGSYTFSGEPAWLPSRPYRAVAFHATRSNFFDAPLSVGAIGNLIECFQADRCEMESREVEFIPWGGAYARETPSSCFDHRGSYLLLRHTGITGSKSSPEMRQHASTWAENSSGSVAHESNGRVYQGYAEPSRADWQTAYYGRAYERLREIKNRYDPERLFSGPQTIA